MTTQRRYLVATQQPWGRAVFDRLDGLPGMWAFMHDQPDGGGPGLADLCEQIDPHIIFFIHWSDFVPVAITDRWVAVNFHCTNLPDGRGGHPIENLILDGHTFTTLTAHRMTRHVDAGPVYAQWRPISLAGSKTDILSRFIRPAAAMIEAIAAGHCDPPIEQADLSEYGDGTWRRYGRLPIAVCEQLWADRAAGVR